MKYINDKIQDRYEITPLLNIYDNFLSAIFACKPWGHSLQYYLSAVLNCHPDYATYLINRQITSVEEINRILKNIPDERKKHYEEDLIKKLASEDITSEGIASNFSTACRRPLCKG